jgi:CDP-diacylglycerol---serine O-phosphatidyltransferase
MIVRRRRLPAPRNVVVLLPSGATLLNLFFGIFAIVKASLGDYQTAALFVVLGGVADMLDGRIARATGTGTRFGEELDSLVDAITFGLAPAMIIYFSVLNKDGWDWIWAFVYTAAAVTRLARFNVEQAGRAKTHFHGLPSPAAGMTLATYMWFGQTPLYNETILFFGDNRVLADLPWHSLMRFLMGLLAALMVSNVPYPTVPSIGFRSVRQIMGTVVVVGSILGVIFLPREFFFPALLGYVVWGILVYAVIGFLDRPATPTIFLEEEEEPNGDSVVETVAAEAVVVERPVTDRSHRVERQARVDRSERAERPDRGRRERPEGRPPRDGGDSDEAARKKRRRRRGRHDRGERTDRGPRVDAADSSAPAPSTPPAPPKDQNE